MREFKGKVAVITGGASGIGRGIAERCAQEGMKIVLADIEEKALSQTEAEMKQEGATVIAVLTDVSKSKDVETLAQKAFDAFGAVHLLCNNAGVGAGTTVWRSTLADWKWVLGVNLWGVIHGVQTFVPIMLEQDTPCHIVNTASIAGLTSGPGLGVYKVTKHGVVTLSETLYHELVAIGAKIGVSVLCPAWVKTRIMEAERNRPPDLQNPPAQVQMRPEERAMAEAIFEAVQTGMPPQEVAEHVFNAVRENKFYVLTHPEWTPMIQVRMEDILQGRNPTALMQ